MASTAEAVYWPPRLGRQCIGLNVLASQLAFLLFQDDRIYKFENLEVDEDVLDSDDDEDVEDAALYDADDPAPAPGVGSFLYDLTQEMLDVNTG